MNAIDIACRQCAAQPGHDCERWSEPDGTMISVPGLVHPERIEDLAWEKSLGDEQQEPTQEQFEGAISQSKIISNIAPNRHAAKTD